MFEETVNETELSVEFSDLVHVSNFSSVLPLTGTSCAVEITCEEPKGQLNVAGTSTGAPSTLKSALGAPGALSVTDLKGCEEEAAGSNSASISVSFVIDQKRLGTP